MPKLAQAEDQLGALAKEGRLQEIPGYDPEASRERLERAQPFMDSLAADLSPRKGGQEDRQRDAQIRMALRQLNLTGVTEITVVNCMPWPAEVFCGVHRHMVKRADWKKEELFHMRSFGWKDVRIDCGDLGDGKNQITTLLPVEVGIEFKRKYVGIEGELDTDDEGRPIVNKPGGLFVFVGNEQNLPADFAEQLALAKDRLAKFFWAQYQAGQANWQRFKQDPLYITDRMKDAAQFLHKNGSIAVLPEWVAATKNESGVKECPNCAEVIRKAAKQCRYCGAVIHADNSFERKSGGVVVNEPPVQETPRAVDHQLVRPGSQIPSESASNLDDLGILNTDDDSKLPAVKTARPNKPARGNKSVSNPDGD